MVDHQLLVSVVLPFYNAPHLKEAIESILQQTYSNFELILIDNGSTDNSSKIANEYIKHPKVQIVQEPRRGVVYAANTGIELCKGDFIARMDADDISKPDRLENQVNHLLGDKSVDIVSGLVEYSGLDANEGFIHYVNWLNTLVSAEDIYLNQFVEYPLANPTLMFRRKVFNNGMYEEGDFPEDYEFFLRLQSAKIKMVKVNSVVLSWRDSETRLTRTDPRYSQDSFFRVKAKYLAKWLAMKNPHHPKVYLWGAGRLSRRRSEYLLAEGIELVKYIDLKETDQVLHYQSLPTTSDAFIISYVANRNASSQIRTFLNQKGFREGINFIMAS